MFVGGKEELKILDEVYHLWVLCPLILLFSGWKEKEAIADPLTDSSRQTAIF